jgi:hypothetical protein
MKELWKLEESFWMEDANFYDATLATEALMVLPAPAGVLDRSATVASIRSADRWTKVSFSDRHSIRPSSAVVILAYSAHADRGRSGTAYSAQCSSTYVQSDSGWKLALHQQTPLVQAK